MKKLYVFLVVILLSADTSHAQDWNTDGNGTLGVNKFLGTTDQVPIRIRTNNSLRAVFSGDSGWFGLKTSSPKSRFHQSGGDFLVTGLHPNSLPFLATVPDSGIGSRLLWIESRSALRVGALDRVGMSFWNSKAIF
jgi:hypothetical protein